MLIHRKGIRVTQMLGELRLLTVLNFYLALLGFVCFSVPNVLILI